MIFDHGVVMIWLMVDVMLSDIGLLLMVDDDVISNDV